MEWLGGLAQAVIKVALAVSSLIASIAPASGPSHPPSSSHPTSPVPVVARANVANPIPGQLLVRYRDGLSADVVDALERAHGASKKAELRALRVHVLTVAAGLEGVVLQELAADPRVEFVERDFSLAATGTIPNDYWWPSEWSQVKTRTNLAWDLTQGSPNVVIASLDTGVDLSQPDLLGNLVGGYNALSGSSDTTDDNGHGTWSAGVAGATSDNTIGVASYCWRCSLMPVKVLGADGTGTTANVAAGITWATDHGARVISMSLSGTTGTNTLQNAVQYAHSRGVVLVAAAGNSGSATPNYPAAYPEVLGVAGTDPNDALYSWSNYGTWVKLAAPGCSYTTGRAGWYGSFCGTSAATPAVAGIAGLALSYSAGATNTRVEAALEASAVNTGAPVGYGRVDAYATLLALGTPAPPAPTITAAPTASPTPAPAPTLSPSPSPTATSSPGVAILSTTISGAVTNKNPSRTFAITGGSGPGSLVLTYSKIIPLSVTVYGPDGVVVASSSGGSPFAMSFTLTAGTSQIVVSGSAQSSFSLTVTYPAP